MVAGLVHPRSKGRSENLKEQIAIQGFFEEKGFLIIIYQIMGGGVPNCTPSPCIELKLMCGFNMVFEKSKKLQLLGNFFNDVTNMLLSKS